MTLKSWEAGKHEVIEVVVRRQHEPYDRLILRAPVGGCSTWTVLSCERDPHGWRVTAMRCLGGCREHDRKR